ncbi:hypothetical protein [Chitinophaga sp. LS1]|uniref:hypothetical protein n=1 Tax=Chitinophaga sp. LS1 TaxID=3051176 RepID=UPI002AAB342C|nr:hypothetical protein [Chitinophaga sp. LS1]WPV64245.1 hypothetical protein QQL36_20805 [Chitinophaga sp. LS1]
MIRKYIEILNSLRSNEIGLGEFLYLEGKDDDAAGKSCDVNSFRRYQILLAMQYSNRLATDEPILLELFKAEIEARKNFGGGVGESLNLCSYLLSTYRQPAYAELFYQAKFADFDTYCGYDSEYIISAGIRETYEYVKKVQPAFSNDFYEWFGTESECKYTKEDLQEWRRWRSEYFPDQLETREIKDEILLAIEMNEKERMVPLIDQWEAGITDWTEKNLQQLEYYKEQTGDVAGQIWANERLFHFKKTDWEKASILHELAKLYLALNDRDNAWSKLQQLPVYLEKIPEWKTANFGNFFLEAYFDLILLINNPDDSVAKVAYKWASANIRETNHLSWSLMEKAGKSGELMQDLKFSERFYKKLEKAKLAYGHRNLPNIKSRLISFMRRLLRY